jgi:hypothetical protein
MMKWRNTIFVRTCVVWIWLTMMRLLLWRSSSSPSLTSGWLLKPGSIDQLPGLQAIGRISMLKSLSRPLRIASRLSLELNLNSLTKRVLRVFWQLQQLLKKK